MSGCRKQRWYNGTFLYNHYKDTTEYKSFRLIAKQCAFPHNNQLNEKKGR